MTPRRLTTLAVIVLLAIHAGLLAYSATRHSPTMLEPALLTAGLSHWEFGRYELYRVNPPLVRMVAALPVMAAGYEADWSGFYESPGARPEFSMGADFIAANGERSIRLFTIARWACIPFSLIGGWFAFCYSRELWDNDAAGLLRLTVWCFEPNILAHAELITNDAACTAFGLGATWLFWRWLKRPTWGRAALAGPVLGVAQLTKSSWLILFLLWPLLWFIWQIARHHLRSTDAGSTSPKETLNSQHSTLNTLLQLTLLLALALYILNLGYLFDGSFTRLKEFDFISTSLTGLEKSGDVGNRFRDSWLGEIPVPLPQQYVLGVDTQKHDFESWSRPSYLRGEWKQGGWWYYYMYGLWVILHSHGKLVWCVADGAYAKRPFVQPLLAAGVTLVGRLRKDAALWDLPPVEKVKRRGRKRKYGLNRLSLAKRAAHRHGWQETNVSVYGKEVIKRTKTFLATHRTFGGTIRVVIVQERTGPQFFFCTDADASVAEIIECFADRSAIEQVFHDVKEVWGSGQQQVRNLFSNIAVWHMGLWLHTLVELWAWDREANDLVHRDDSPWDRADRRPSHADRRKALQASCLADELSSTTPPRQLTQKIRTLLQRLLRIAV